MFARDEFSFSVELWTARGSIEKTLALLSSLPAARGAFHAAKMQYPGREVTLRQGCRGDRRAEGGVEAVKRLAGVVLLLLTALPAAADITGPARILDGDTVEIETTRIRLHGTDAPEMDQVCLDAEGKRLACGIVARDHLARIGGRAALDVLGG